MILWGRPSSVNVQKVLWALEELGLRYEHKIVGGKYGGTDDPAFVAMNPARRVPVLQVGDMTLWESHAILRYLAQGQTPPLADMWLEFGSTTLQPPFLGVFWQRVRMTQAQQSKEALTAHLGALKSAISIMEAGFSNGRAFAGGAAFTMADIALGSLFYRIIDLYPDILDPFPKVAKWHAALAERSGYTTHVATSYDELKAAS